MRCKYSSRSASLQTSPSSPTNPGGKRGSLASSSSRRPPTLHLRRVLPPAARGLVLAPPAVRAGAHQPALPQAPRVGGSTRACLPAQPPTMTAKLKAATTVPQICRAGPTLQKGSTPPPAALAPPAPASGSGGGQVRRRRVPGARRRSTGAPEAPRPPEAPLPPPPPPPLTRTSRLRARPLLLLGLSPLSSIPLLGSQRRSPLHVAGNLSGCAPRFLSAAWQRPNGSCGCSGAITRTKRLRGNTIGFGATCNMRTATAFSGSTACPSAIPRTMVTRSCCMSFRSTRGL